MAAINNLIGRSNAAKLEALLNGSASAGKPHWYNVIVDLKRVSMLTAGCALGASLPGLAEGIGRFSIRAPSVGDHASRIPKVVHVAATTRS